METWIKRNFAVSAKRDDELRFPCPKCGYENFYFNLTKKVGWCHRASCHFAPSLRDLTSLIGTTPAADVGFVPSRKLDNPLKPVTLPRDCINALEDKDITIALAMRGVTEQKIEKYNVQCTLNQIVIPVTDTAGQLLQYVGRNINRAHPPTSELFWKDVGLRYSYFPDWAITDHLFHWGRKSYEHLTLVENTFNAIWLDELDVTSNFGSHLTDKQVEQIAKTSIKTLILLWDEGAETQKTIKRLRKMGIRSAAVEIKGQPDNYDYLTLKELIQGSHMKLLEDGSIKCLKHISS